MMWKMEEVPVFVAKKLTLEDFSSDLPCILIAPDVACGGIDMKVTPYVFLSLASVSKGYIFYVFHIYIIIIN